MRTPVIAILALALAPSAASAAPLAADDDKKPDAAAADEGDEKSTALPDKEVKVGGAVLGESVGGATGFEFKQGFWTQSDLGGFFRLGGFTINDTCGGVPCSPVVTSQLQPYIGLSAGYDLFPWLGLQASFGTGFVANAAPYGNRSPNVPRDYGITSIDVGATFSIYMPAPADRLAIAIKPFGGVTFLTPEPDVKEPTTGGNAGIGVGIRYATLLPNTFIGVDWNTVYVIVPTSGGGLIPMGFSADAGSDAPGIVAFSFAPVIKYVF
jgi:hypothetical protein